MIVGTGMLAKAFKKYENSQEVIIFASGVSNSRENRVEEYLKEKKLLESTIEANKNCTLIYFSTTSINDDSINKSDYVKHKMEMERLIQKLCLKFYIFRLSQVVGVSMSPTITNFFYNSIINNQEFTVYKQATRNLIDVDDVFIIADFFIQNCLYFNDTTYIASPYNIPVEKIVKTMEQIVEKKARYNLVNEGRKQLINIDKISVLPNYDEKFHSDYTKKVLLKYYLKNDKCRGD